MNTFQRLTSALFPFRRWLLVVALAGAVTCGLVLLLVPSQLGFALAGPFAIFPWCLMCVARAKAISQSLFFAAGAVVGLAWPALVYFT